MASFNGPLSCPRNLGLQLFGLLAILTAGPAATAVPAADPLSSGRFWRSFCGANRDPYSSQVKDGSHNDRKTELLPPHSSACLEVRYGSKPAKRCEELWQRKLCRMCGSSERLG